MPTAGFRKGKIKKVEVNIQADVKILSTQRSALRRLASLEYINGVDIFPSEVKKRITVI